MSYDYSKFQPDSQHHNHGEPLPLKKLLIYMKGKWASAQLQKLETRRQTLHTERGSIHSNGFH